MILRFDCTGFDIVANLPRQLTYATSQIDFEVAMRRGEVEDRCLYLRNREVRGACLITTQITVKLPALCNEPLGGSLVTMLRTRIIKATNKISLLFMSGGKTSVVFLQKREFFSITRRYALLSLTVDNFALIAGSLLRQRFTNEHAFDRGNIFFMEISLGDRDKRPLLLGWCRIAKRRVFFYELPPLK